MSRLGERYWDRLPWQGVLERDDHFRHLEGEQVVADAGAALNELDDFALFALFSVFEAVVRRLVSSSLEAEVAGLKHPALRRSAQKLMRNIDEGSFYANVLELYKQHGSTPDGQIVDNLIEEVNRVRHYRNWVAHGRNPDKKPDPILPRHGYDALRRFLDFAASV